MTLEVLWKLVYMDILTIYVYNSKFEIGLLIENTSIQIRKKRFRIGFISLVILIQNV